MFCRGWLGIWACWTKLYKQSHRNFQNSGGCFLEAVHMVINKLGENFHTHLQRIFINIKIHLMQRRCDALFFISGAQLEEAGRLFPGEVGKVLANHIPGIGGYKMILPKHLCRRGLHRVLLPGQDGQRLGIRLHRDRGIDRSFGR